MECHLVEQRRGRFINVHLVVKVIILVREVRHTDVVLLLTEQDTPCFTLCMVRLVINFLVIIFFFIKILIYVVNIC